MTVQQTAGAYKILDTHLDGSLTDDNIDAAAELEAPTGSYTVSGVTPVIGLHNLWYGL